LEAEARDGTFLAGREGKGHGRDKENGGSEGMRGKPTSRESGSASE